MQEIHDRLSSNDEALIISGLRILKNFLQAFEFEVDEDRKPAYVVVDAFFPLIEKLVTYVLSGSSPN